LDCLQDCTVRTGIRGRALDWLFVSALSNAIMAGSGSSHDPEKGPISVSQSQSEETDLPRRHVLIIEDNKADAALIRKALMRAGIDTELHELDDGEKAIRFFDGADADPNTPCPDLILLDINMPRYKGDEILRHLRASPRCGKSLVLVVTSSDSEKDRREMDDLGANGYFRKPSEFAEFMKLGQVARELLRNNPSDPLV
jgi:chemotaxis family two-component system response regulator Rcp1